MATNEKLTQRTFLENILLVLEDREPNVAPEDLHEFALARIAKIDETNAARRNAERKLSAKEQAEAERNEALRALLITSLTLSAEPMTGGALAELLEVTKGKIAALAKPLVAAGRIAKTEVRGEKDKIVAYKICADNP